MKNPCGSNINGVATDNTLYVSKSESTADMLGNDVQMFYRLKWPTVSVLICPFPYTSSSTGKK